MYLSCFQDLAEKWFQSDLEYGMQLSLEVEVDGENSKLQKWQEFS